MDNDAAKLLTSEFVFLHDELKAFRQTQDLVNAAILQALGELSASLNDLKTRLGVFQQTTQQEIETIMANLDNITAAVQREESVDQSIVALVQGLAQQIEALKTDPAALQALADRLNASADAVAAAVTANTPADTGGGTGGGTTGGDTGGTPPTVRGR